MSAFDVLGFQSTIDEYTSAFVKKTYKFFRNNLLFHVNLTINKLPQGHGCTSAGVQTFS